jgi:hypothetical protein
MYEIGIAALLLLLSVVVSVGAAFLLSQMEPYKIRLCLLTSCSTSVEPISKSVDAAER